LLISGGLIFGCIHFVRFYFLFGVKMIHFAQFLRSVSVKYCIVFFSEFSWFRMSPPVSAVIRWFFNRDKIPIKAVTLFHGIYFVKHFLLCNQWHFSSYFFILCFFTESAILQIYIVLPSHCCY
jgi:hypothetical protein